MVLKKKTTSFTRRKKNRGEFVPAYADPLRLARFLRHGPNRVTEKKVSRTVMGRSIDRVLSPSPHRKIVIFNRWRDLLRNRSIKDGMQRQVILSGVSVAGADLSTRIKKIGGEGFSYVAADLSGADLFKTNLSYTNARGVSFEGAYIDRAKITNAHLDDANFRGVVNLQTVKGLDTARLKGAVFSGSEKETVSSLAQHYRFEE